MSITDIAKEVKVDARRISLVMNVFEACRWAQRSNRSFTLSARGDLLQRYDMLERELRQPRSEIDAVKTDNCVLTLAVLHTLLKGPEKTAHQLAETLGNAQLQRRISDILIVLGEMGFVLNEHQMFKYNAKMRIELDQRVKTADGDQKYLMTQASKLTPLKHNIFSQESYQMDRLTPHGQTALSCLYSLTQDLPIVSPPQFLAERQDDTSGRDRSPPLAQ